MQRNTYNCGWWLKVPYTANNLHYHGRSYGSFILVLDELRRIRVKTTLPILTEMFPYVLLQPTVPEHKECKVILHGGVPKYFHQRGESNISPRKGTQERTDMFAFAMLARDTLAARCPHAIMDGLVRIDIMRLPNKSLIVNEIEGVDSYYVAKNGGMTLSTQEFLQGYWKSVVKTCFQEFLA